MRVWLGRPPIEEGESTIALDIFDSRPPLRTPEGGFGRMEFSLKGPEGTGFVP